MSLLSRQLRATLFHVVLAEPANLLLQLPHRSLADLLYFLYLIRLLPPSRVTLCSSPYQYHSMDFTSPLFSYSYALFCTVKNAISNRFKLFRTLCTKHPGCGVPLSSHETLSSPLASHPMQAVPCGGSIKNQASEFQYGGDCAQACECFCSPSFAFGGRPDRSAGPSRQHVRAGGDPPNPRRGLRRF
jgi:hypothetical protein